MINDIFALRAPGALEAVAETPAARVPDAYARRAAHHAAGTALPRRGGRSRSIPGRTGGRRRRWRYRRDRIVLDPGFGFGKTPHHNLELIRAIPRLCEAGFPLLAGCSRKGLFGKIVGREAMERVTRARPGHYLRQQRGASIVRVHDVAATRDCLLVLRAIETRLSIPMKIKAENISVPMVCAGESAKCRSRRTS